MKNNNLKAILPYIGCKFMDEHGHKWDFTGIVITKISGPIIIDHNEGTDLEFFIEDSRLLLRPIESLTNEECMDLANLKQHRNSTEVIFYKDTRTIEYWVIRDNGSKVYKTSLYLTSLKPHHYQYLQSIYIDLPSFYLGGKTLKESNLAIYE